MEQKLDLIVQILKDQGKKIDLLNVKHDSLREEMNEKYDSLNEKYDLLNEKYDLLNEKYDSLNGKYDSLREETNEKYDSLREETNIKHDSLRKDIIRIEEKLDNLSNQVTVLEDYAHDRCEAALDAWASHLQIQEEIKNNVKNLNSRIENHEIRISVLEDVIEA